jgi:hypothetical protein
MGFLNIKVIGQAKWLFPGKKIQPLPDNLQSLSKCARIDATVIYKSKAAKLIPYFRMTKCS